MLSRESGGSRSVKRTTIEINESLIAEGLKGTGLDTVSALIDRALRELVRRERQRAKEFSRPPPGPPRSSLTPPQVP